MKNNNYPNWLVPLEIAKELKEIGFDTPCSFYYDEKLLKISPWHDEEFVVTNWNDKLFRYCVSIPTWEQVFEWFRDRKYYGTLNTYKDGFSFYCEINYNNQYIKVYSKTYEEAREELVKTLIRTYKSEQL